MTDPSLDPKCKTFYTDALKAWEIRCECGGRLVLTKSLWNRQLLLECEHCHTSGFIWNNDVFYQKEFEVPNE